MPLASQCPAALAQQEPEAMKLEPWLPISALLVISSLPFVFAANAEPNSARMAQVNVTARDATAPSPSQKVTVRFTWKVTGYYAPLFLALDRGYYSEEGLDVQLAEGSGSETVVKLIANGTDSIGYGPASVAAEAVSRGLPVKVVAIYQTQTPMGLISFPEIALSSPKDLENKTVGLTVSEALTNMFVPFLRMNDVDVSRVKVIQMDQSARNGQFMARKIDVMSVYIIDQIPILEKRTNAKFNVLDVSKFGLSVLGQSMIVNDEFARKNPELVSKLLRATAKGFAATKEDPVAAAVAINKRRPVPLDMDVAVEQVRLTLQWTDFPTTQPMGWQSADKWQSTLAVLHADGIVREVREISSYYTNEYLR
jgi:NitT/TauT family transport system substrate-binding protein